jgi:hypothetical protein
MSWNNSYRTWGFNAMTTYDQAARWESEVKPIRGDVNGTKPLGDRKKKYINIRKEEATSDIICRIGSTDVVRYKRNGDVVVNIGGYSSSTTNDFLGQLLHMDVRTFDNKSWVKCFYQSTPMETAASGEYALPNNKDVTFRMDALSRVWVTPDVIPAYTHKVNREKSNLVRKSYASFTRYLRNMVKLRAETIEKQHWTGDTLVERVVTISNGELASLGIKTGYNERLSFKPHSNPMAQNVRGMMISDDPEQHYRAFVHIIHGASGYSYMAQRGISVYANAIGDFYNKFLLFAHKDDVLEKTISDSNSVKRDPYGAWFK